MDIKSKKKGIFMDVQKKRKRNERMGLLRMVTWYLVTKKIGLIYWAV